jgi:peptidoglycan/LPS O-acetylase OafA/YrhL
MGAMAESPNRIPSLDGLRAVSIVAVVLGHLTGTVGFPAFVTPIVMGPFDTAHEGVRVFFVISGFLITGLLLNEEDRKGRVRLGQFYLRRTARIVPAYATYLAVVAILTLAGVIAVSGRDFLHAVTWTMNYHHGGAWETGHLWSLAVEEQFYLLWPLTLVLAGRRRAALVACAVVCIVPVIRYAGYLKHQHVGYTFETAADALALGCLLALWRDRLPTRLLRGWMAPVLMVAATVVGTVFYRTAMLTQDTLNTLGAAALVLWSVEHPTSAWGRFLNTRALVAIGALSYSLYLWQQLFINRANPMLPFPINLLIAVACALVSYRLIEQPARHWGRRGHHGAPPHRAAAASQRSSSTPRATVSSTTTDP